VVGVGLGGGGGGGLVMSTGREQETSIRMNVDRKIFFAWRMTREFNFKVQKMPMLCNAPLSVVFLSSARPGSCPSATHF